MIDILVVIKLPDSKKSAYAIKKEKSCSGILSWENFGNFGVFWNLRRNTGTNYVL